MASKSACYLLAIESSCDDTSAAVLADGVVLSNVIASQQIHEQYGGVVPEVASRAHQINLVPVVEAALRQANIEAKQLHAIAVTGGPGLMGALLVGVSFAKGLSFALSKPLIAVHHLQAHALAHLLEQPAPEFPFLCLTVSGGHTQLEIIHSPLRREVIGRTRDDAAGEAFDKTGKLLGLGYPAGPLIDHWAQRGQPVFDFPDSQVPGLDFSFSGLKTAVLYFLQAQQRSQPDFIARHLPDLCASIQTRIVQMLMRKLQTAVAQTGIRRVGIAGGVSANSQLRSTLQQYGKRYGWQTFVPRLSYCTDNAAMIGVAGYYQFLAGEYAPADFVPFPTDQVVPR